MKPKTNRTGHKNKSAKYDRCQTPYYALDPLLPHLPAEWIYWEPACGDGHIVAKLESNGLKVQATDILDGHNFFDWQPDRWHCQITNPPYSVKYDWLARSYQLGKPFALLLPVETIGAATAQKLFNRHDLEVVFLNKRVNFKMPDQGYNGGGAQFPVAWFTWGLDIGQQITFAKISYYPDNQLSLLEAA